MGSLMTTGYFSTVVDGLDSCENLHVLRALTIVDGLAGCIRIAATNQGPSHVAIYWYSASARLSRILHLLDI